MGATAHAVDDEGSGRRVRETGRRSSDELASAARRPVEWHARVLRQRAARVADGVELSLRHRASSRAAHDLSATDGIDGAANLWAKRGRAVTRHLGKGALSK